MADPSLRCRRCGHAGDQHPRPRWLWRWFASLRWAWTPFACRGTVTNGAGTCTRRCVCRGWVGVAPGPLKKTVTLTLAEATVVRHVLHLGLQVGRHGGTLDDDQVALIRRVADQLAVYG